jgi:hypothetical protein
VTERTRGEVFATLVEAVLAEERELKISLMQRATNVITGAGVLVSVSLGIGTLVYRTPLVGVPAVAVGAFGAAVVLLLGAALLALLVNAPQGQDALDLESLRLRPLQRSDWDRVDDSELEVYQLRLALAAALSTANQRRGRRLTAALTLELFALAGLAVAAISTVAAAL